MKLCRHLTVMNAVFQATPTGTVTLNVPRYIADQTCTSGVQCVTCKGTRYRASTSAQLLTYGIFGQPPGKTSIRLKASMLSAAGLVANLTWPDATFPKNAVATSSNPSIAAWTAYIQRSQGDTGQVAMDFLQNYTFFTSDALPEGELRVTDDGNYIIAEKCFLTRVPSVSPSNAAAALRAKFNRNGTCDTDPCTTS